MWDRALLVGRERECREVDRLLAGARGGRSSVLVLTGEAGVGKSALLAYARKRAQGMRVLGAQGVQAETTLPFAALSSLLGPVLDRRGAIPPPQAAALEGALALGRPHAGDRFAIHAATFSLLAAAAEERPVLALVDDAHWLDTGSQEALLFAARRLEAEGVVLLFAVREGEPEALSASRLPVMRLGGLGRDGVDALIAGRGRRAGPEVVDALHSATRGNPLALSELLERMTDAQLAGREPMDDPIPAGATLEQYFVGRCADLSAGAQTALLLAAASSSGGLDEISGALAILGIEESVLEEAEAAGLVELHRGAVVLRHPLIRSAVYHAASGADRRAAHRTLAEAISDDDPDRSVWHRAEAALGVDEELAESLERAATRASHRGAHASAASQLQRAGDLSADRERRARRLLAAARALELAGLPDRALALLEQAQALADEETLRAQIQLLQGTLMIWRRPVEGSTLLSEIAAGLADRCPNEAAGDARHRRRGHVHGRARSAGA